jgi:hypothetical protein
MLGVTVETLIVSYHLLLGLALIAGTQIWKGLALAGCLLSRYSVVLWVPLALAVFWMRDGYKSVMTISLIFLGVFSMTYLPFLLDDPMSFKKGYDYHSQAAVNLWHPRDWQNPDDTPENLLQGLGFGIYFYENISGDISDKVAGYKLAHVLLSSLTVLALGLFYFTQRAKIDYRLFLLGSLKIYLVVFYNFIQIPFHYLYLVSVFIGIPMIGSVFSLSTSAPEEGS